MHHVDFQIKSLKSLNQVHFNKFKTYKATWALRWQPQRRIGWHDTQIGPPNHASTLN